MDDRGRARTFNEGGYDEGYRACPCFWGTTPGSLVLELAETVPLAGSSVLDLGCGEGKNAAWLAERGCSVRAVDVSQLAIANARQAFRGADVDWVVDDVTAHSW